MFSCVFKNIDMSTKKLNISKTTLYRWLNGDDNIGLKMYLAMSDFYNLNPNISYLNEFCKIAKTLNTHTNIEQILKTLKSSKLDYEDVEILKNYNIKRILRQKNAK